METPILCWGIYRVLQGEWKRKWKLPIIIGCVQGLYRDNIWHKPIHMTYVVITVLSHTLCLVFSIYKCVGQMCVCVPFPRFTPAVLYFRNWHRTAKEEGSSGPPCHACHVATWAGRRRAALCRSVHRSRPMDVFFCSASVCYDFVIAPTILPYRFPCVIPFKEFKS